MTDEPGNWGSLGQVVDGMVKEATRPLNYGWFESPDDTAPAHDPWLTSFCPYCGEGLGVDDVRTQSFSAEDKAVLPWNYFFYTHRSCDRAATQAEKNAAFQYVVGTVLGKSQ